MNKLKCELHSHTKYSRDSNQEIDQIIKTCVKKNIDCLAVTDHNEIKGAFEMKSKAPFKVIIGEEINTSEGEIIGYFLNKLIQPNLSPEQTIKKIKNQGGLVAIPHPFDRFRTSRMKFDTLKRVIDKVDILEVFNSRNLLMADDIKSKLYCREKNKIASVGSDAHIPYEFGRSYTVLDNFNNSQEFLVSLKKAKLIKKRSPIWVHFYTKYNKFISS